MLIFKIQVSLTNEGIPFSLRGSSRAFRSLLCWCRCCGRLWFFWGICVTFFPFFKKIVSFYDLRTAARAKTLTLKSNTRAVGSTPGLPMLNGQRSASILTDYAVLSWAHRAASYIGQWIQVLLTEVSGIVSPIPGVLTVSKMAASRTSCRTAPNAITVQPERHCPTSFLPFRCIGLGLFFRFLMHIANWSTPPALYRVSVPQTCKWLYCRTDLFWGIVKRDYKKTTLRKKSLKVQEPSAYSMSFIGFEKDLSFDAWNVFFGQEKKKRHCLKLS